MYKFLFKDSEEVFDPIARQKILEKVYFHKDKWKALTDYVGTGVHPGMEHMYFFGDGLYVLQEDKAIDQEVQEILDTEFSELIYSVLKHRNMFGIGVKII